VATALSDFDPFIADPIDKPVPVGKAPAPPTCLVASQWLGFAETDNPVALDVCDELMDLPEHAPVTLPRQIVIPPFAGE